MESTTAEILTGPAAAEIIRNETGRSCTRQNLEKLCKHGRLPKSTISAQPVRVRADSIVAEYLAHVAPAFAGEVNPKAASRPPSPPPSEEPPAYHESRARHEHEKANLAEIARKEKEGLLLNREEVEATWAAMVTNARVKLLALHTVVRQQIPHLTLEETSIISGVVREALEELADGSD